MAHAPRPHISLVTCFEDNGKTEYVHPYCVGPKYNYQKGYPVPINTLASGTRCAMCNEIIEQKESK